jgi:hypothetical protein
LFWFWFGFETYQIFAKSYLVFYSRKGQTALYCAARQGWTQIVSELVSIPTLNPDIQMIGHLGSALHGKSSIYFLHSNTFSFLFLFSH